MMILVWLLMAWVAGAGPVLAQGCTTQTYIINGKIMVCTICPGMTMCN